MGVLESVYIPGLILKDQIQHIIIPNVPKGCWE